MGIEVRQLIVNATTEKKSAATLNTSHETSDNTMQSKLFACDIDQLKAELVKQCQMLIIETLRREKER